MATIRRKAEDGYYPKLTMQQFITLANMLTVRDASRIDSCKVLVFGEKLTQVAKHSDRTTRSIRNTIDALTRAHWWILSGYEFTDQSEAIAPCRLNVLLQLLNIKAERGLPIMAVLLHNVGIRQSAEQYQISASFLSTQIKRLREANTEVMQSYNPNLNQADDSKKERYVKITTRQKSNACAVGM